MSLHENCFNVSESQSKAISLLVQLLKNNGDKILSGTTKLSLTTPVLHLINEGFSHVVDRSSEKTFHVQRLSDVENPISENLICLFDFIQKTVCVKITHGITTLQNNVNLLNFRNLHFLEIKKVPVHMIIGLKDLRPRLTTLICSRCLNKLNDIFEVCGADRAEASLWPMLRVVILSYNNLEELDKSLMLLPNVEVLDLSHNSIRNTTFIECLSKIGWLNLSYNHLQSLPILNTQIGAYLKVLNLRNNNLDDLKGLHQLTCLEELDLGFNFLIHHAQLTPLRCLNVLKILCLDGNPLYFHNKHRMLTVQYLNHQVFDAKFLLDGRCLSQKEILRGKNFETPLAFRSVATSSGNYESSYNSLSSGSDLRKEESQESSQNENFENSLYSINNTGNIRRKERPLIREVNIEDDTRVTDDKSLPKPQSSNLVHLEIKNKVENFRKQRGSNWLVASLRSEEDFPLPRVIKDFSNTGSYNSLNNEKDNMSLCSANESSDTDFYQNRNQNGGQNGDQNGGQNRDQNGGQIEDAERRNVEIYAEIHSEFNSDKQPDNIEQHEFDPVVISKEPELFGNSSHSADNNFDDYEDVDGEVDDDNMLEQLFIVDCHCNNQITNLFVSIRKDTLKEKDVFTARILERFDIKSLLDIEKLSHIPNGIRLTFDYIRKDRRERIYALEDEANLKLFMSLLQPSVDERVLKDATMGAFQCLACNAQFSKGVAILKLQTSTASVKGANGKTKDILKEVNACPNCDSVMIIELDEESAAKCDKLSPPVKRKQDGKFSDDLMDGKDDTEIIINSNLFPQTIAKLRSDSHSYPATPERSRKSFSENQANRAFLEQKNRNELFKFSKNRRNYRSLESSPLSQSPSSLKLDLYGRDEVREESVCKIREESPELANSNEVAFQSLDLNSLSLTQDNEGKLSESSKKQSSSFKNFNDRNGKYDSEPCFSTPILTPSMRRSESDVTILSNPSQSSISVLSTPSGDQGMSEFELNSELQKLDSVFCFESRVDSRQSNSSVTGSFSSSTTVERSAYDGNSSTPSMDGRRDFSSTPRLQMTMSNDSILESEGTIDSSESLNFNSGVNEQQDAVNLSNTSDYPSSQLSTENIIAKNFDQLDVVQCNAIRYSYDDFSQIDHKIQLYLDVSLFESKEEFKLILKANVVTSKLNDVPALLIISNKNIYLMKITGEETVEPIKWLQKVDVKQVSQLKRIRQHLGYQGFYIEFDKQSKASCFFVLRDSERCKRFIKQLSCYYDSLSITIEIIEPQDNLLNNLTLTLNDNCKNFDCGDEIYILLYTMGFCKNSDKGQEIFEPVSFVVTKNCIFVLAENYQWHLNYSKSEKVFQILRHQNIISLTGMELNENNRCEAKMPFFNEDTDENFEWSILMETERSLHFFIEAVQESWKKLYEIDLPIENV